MPSVIARIHSLDSEGARIREHRNKYGPGITPVYNQDGQVLEIRFSELSEPDAMSWLELHGYHGFTLEGDESHPETREGKRYLAVELTPSNDIQDLDGGLLVPGVMLIAPGTWTDSTSKTPCRYTAEVLERYAANWIDKSYWSRHGGGVPRDITDRIADLQNIRFDKGLVADIFLHGATSKSKDAISLLKAAAAGKVPWPYSSVEMKTRDRWIVSEKVYEAQEIVFGGAAMVNQGACRVCKIRNNEWVQEDPAGIRELGSVPSNPPGSKIGEDAAGCKLTKSAFGDMSFSDIRKRFAYDGNAAGEEEFSKLSLPHHSVDGTVRPNCVRAALQAIGGARQGTPMDLGGKEGSVKAHLQAHLDAIEKKQQEEGNMADLKELEEKVSKLEKSLETSESARKDLEAKLKPADPPKVEIPKELTESITALVNDNKDLKARLKALEEDGKARTAGTPRDAETADPINAAILVDRKTGTIRSV